MLPLGSFSVKDLTLADAGDQRIEWSFLEMPVLRLLESELGVQEPLQGIRISACLHITTETANLARVLKTAGADVALCASNPLSTQDDVAAALVSHYDIPVFARHNESADDYYHHIDAILDLEPHIVMDDGADLINQIHKSHTPLLKHLVGGTEETTTGVIRLRAMARAKALGFPVIAVNDAMTKHFFDNRYGTGQSTLDGILRATNVLLAGKNFTVVGYGWCGRGIAMRARGMGAKVIVTEVDAVRSLEAAMDGYQVMPLIDAIQDSDFVVTATGDKNVVDRAHLEVAKNHCILANAGHFNVEINLAALDAMAVSRHKPRPSVEAFTLPGGRTICVLAEGRLVNLAAAEGHPSAVMDMSFANQTLTAVYLSGRPELTNAVHSVPENIDQRVASLKLEAMNIRIDRLTQEQHSYLHSWQEGT